MGKPHVSDNYDVKVGPDGELAFVPKGSRKDPWIDRRLDRCPICFVKGMRRKGEVTDKTAFNSGRATTGYKCRICHYDWVWDKRRTYWTSKQLKEI